MAVQAFCLLLIGQGEMLGASPLLRPSGSSGCVDWEKMGFAGFLAFSIDVTATAGFAFSTVTSAGCAATNNVSSAALLPLSSSAALLLLLSYSAALLLLSSSAALLLLLSSRLRVA
jgi:hypothetical protein